MSIQDAQNAVREFHETYGAPVADHPTYLSQEALDRRERLLLEELEETIEWAKRRNMIEVADGIGDMLFIVLGWAVEAGIDIEPVFWEIVRSNRTKLGADGQPIRSDGTDGYPKGKVLKGPNYEPPALGDILDKQWLTPPDENGRQYFLGVDASWFETQDGEHNWPFFESPDDGTLWAFGHWDEEEILEKAEEWAQEYTDEETGIEHATVKHDYARIFGAADDWYIRWNVPVGSAGAIPVTSVVW